MQENNKLLIPNLDVLFSDVNSFQEEKESSGGLEN